MNTSLDDVDWLTRSENRVRVLDLLAERSRDAAELLEEVGVSRVTFNRLLENLEEREWIEGDRSSRTYEITPCGRLVTEDLDRLLETTDTAERLGDIQRYLPVEEFDFDLRRLGSARITQPTATDTVAPLRRSAELMSESTERFNQLIANVDRLHTRGAGELDAPENAEGIYTAEVLETVLADSVMREDTTAFIEAGFGLYLYDGSASITLSLFDDIVGFELNDGRGFVPAFIETDDPEVLDWAERTYEQYKRESEPLDVDAFAA